MHIAEQRLIESGSGDNLLLGFREFAGLEEGILYVGISSESYIAVDSRHVQITPVDADMVAGLGKDRLLHGSGLHICDSILFLQSGNSGGILLILRDTGRGSEEDLHIVSLSVIGFHIIRDIVDRGREQVVILDKHRCGENKIQIHRTASEVIISGGSHHIHAVLHGIPGSLAVNAEIAVDSEIGPSTAGVVVAMCSDKIFSGVEEFLDISGEVQFRILALVVNSCSHLCSIDEDLHSVIVRIYEE